MTSATTTRFNAEAAAWDSNPTVVVASGLAHKAILDRFPGGSSTTSKLDVLEIGCGTGLLTLALAPHFRSVTAVDAAEGMIAALQSKLSAEGCETKNVRAVAAMLEDPDDERIRPDAAASSRGVEGGTALEPRRLDLVVSHLVLHHIPDLLAVLKTMLGCLKPGGQVMLTDFENFGPEARRFHPESRMEGVERHGIRRTDIEDLLKRAGFVDVRIETAFNMDKAVETEPGSEDMGPIMTFPFLICTGRKPGGGRSEPQ
ncbi:S-adenosyl-L-methionine-dependent methyltransferase [Coniochaeta sp. 2T2.1]|nr:S-adenosyl-L-methionine-dependent methyltransferase [Coniochaeta sp. 2T2.1]